MLILLVLGLAACAGSTPGTGAEITTVTVSPGSLELEVGQAGTLTASVTGTGNFDNTVTWSSSDQSVATVNTTGVVTGVATGTATITARSVGKPSIQGTAQADVTSDPAAECPEPGQLVEIPDERLRNRLLDIMDTDEITECELAKVERINGQNYGIQSLTGLEFATGLKELDVMLNQVSDLAPISDLNLEVLKLSANPISDLTPITGMTSLRQLQLEYISALDDLGILADLVNLEVLLIPGTQVTDLSLLEEFPKLSFLGVGTFADNGPEDFSVLTRIPNLVTLYLTMLPAKDLELLEDIPKLTNLILETHEAYPNISVIMRLTQLQELSIKLPKLTELDVLRGMTRLTRLNVAGSYVTDLAPLLEMTELMSLDVRNNCLPADPADESSLNELLERGVAISYLYQRSSGC